MGLVRMTEYRTLALATAAFNLSFLVWFSFAPFAGAIADEFGLSTADIGLLASAAVWGVVPGRIVVGWLSDRFGAPVVFAALLSGVGLASIASAFAASYAAFFGSRLVVAFAGVSFVAGVQHVSQWFPEERLGTAQGVYAGIGNAGAAGGALLLPRLFGDWTGPLFDAGWRAAFLVTGLAAVAMGVAYALLGEAAPTAERARATSESASLRGFLYTATRYGVVVLSFGYVVSFGLEVSMNGWLPTYFGTAFDADVVLAGTFAAVFSLAAGLLRPLGGYISDRAARAERDLLPGYTGRYREQWTVIAMSGIVVSLVLLTLAGRTGSLPITVGAVFLVGAACAFTEAAIFAQVPATFPDRAGVAAGVVGGVGTAGGAGFPLVFAGAAGAGFVHYGYLAVAAVVIPVLVLHGVLARPWAASRARTDGLLDGAATERAPSDD